MCQLHALTYMENQEFNAYELAMAYKLWYNTHPFDVGQTTNNGLSTLVKIGIP